MLPALLTSPRKLATLGIAAAVASTLASAPALAWGDKQQNFVAGVASTLLLEGIFAPQMFTGKSHQPRGDYYQYYTPPPVYTPAPIYYSPAPTYSLSSVYGTPAASAFNSYAPDERRRIQSTLATYGYYHGSIDGSFGPGTYDAVMAYSANTGKSGMMSTQAGAYTLYDGLLF